MREGEWECEWAWLASFMAFNIFRFLRFFPLSLRVWGGRKLPVFEERVCPASVYSQLICVAAREESSLLGIHGTHTFRRPETGDVGVMLRGIRWILLENYGFRSTDGCEIGLMEPSAYFRTIPESVYLLPVRVSGNISSCGRSSLGGGNSKQLWLRLKEHNLKNFALFAI